MPAMLRTSSKTRKIALNILGKPINYETPAQIRKGKKIDQSLMRSANMRQR